VSKLRLIVVLDLTHDLEAVEEAYERNVMSMSLVNAHSDLSRITYPIYAGE
jgi:ribosomal protein S2